MAQQLIDDVNSKGFEELLGKFGDESNAEERKAVKEKLFIEQAKEIHEMKEKFLEYR
jgi:hypothetical protein